MTVRRLIPATCAAFALAVPLGVAQGATIVNPVPASNTPSILNGRVYALTKVGSITLVGGTFTSASSPGGSTVAANYLLAYDSNTGNLLSGFDPDVDNAVFDLIPGPTAGTVYVAGQFNNAGGQTTRRVALLNASTGRAITSFRSPGFNGIVKGIRRVGSRLMVGGSFSTAGPDAHAGLASINATTGALDPYLNVQLAERHGGGNSVAPVGAIDIDVSPDGSTLAVIGNFKKADGLSREQAVLVDLGATAATVRDWQTDAFLPRCSYNAFDTYMRDIDYAPDGSYFAIATTGGGHVGTACDAITRFESGATGSGINPTWVAATGGDTLLSVVATESAIFTGGHQRWMNNPTGVDRARPGSVPRAGIAALSPVTGLPLAWNPGRHPRGEGAYVLYHDAAGLLVGSDTEWVGNFTYRRPRVALFPTAGSLTIAPDTLPALPAQIFVGAGAGSATGLAASGFDGTTASPRADVDALGLDWSRVRGAFVAGGRLFYGWDTGTMYVRTFDGLTLGPARELDPYHDPDWATVPVAGNTTVTYDGSTVDFYGQIPSVTSMTYAGEHIYYTRSGSSALYSRAFNVDSGIVGPEAKVVAASGWSGTGGLFATNGTLWRVASASTVQSYPITAGGGLGSPTTLSTGVDWTGGAVFAGPAAPASAIRHRNTAATSAAGTSFSVTVPGDVQAGDLMVLGGGFTVGNPLPSAPAGWQVRGNQTHNGLRSMVWTKTATAADAGSTVTIATTKNVRASLTLSAYADAAAVRQIAFTKGATTATTPTVSTGSGDVVLELRYGRSFGTPSWTTPPGTTRRAVTTWNGAAPVASGLAVDAFASGATGGGNSSNSGLSSAWSISWALSLRQ